MSLELKPLISKLNPTCRRAFETAAELCVSQTNYSVEIEHLLVKLLELPNTDIQRVLRYYDIDTSKLTRELNQSIERFKRGNTRTPTMSPYILALLKEAWMISSLNFSAPGVRSGGILQAIVDHDTLRGALLETLPALMRIPRESLREDIRELIKGSSEESTAAAQPQTSAPTSTAEMAATPEGTPNVSAETPALDQFTVNLTEEAANGKIDPVTGRDAEIRQIIDILMRRRQNNPILTGEAGVGKTAVVDGFALRVAEGDVPPVLQNVVVRTLDMGLLQAGASMKGEFENRVKSVITEVKSSPQPIILFIDEAHSMIGAGGTAGQGDAANLLKPALARGELRTVAATTWAEYKKYFEKDPALTRRFQVVKVDEPNEEAAINMLRASVETLEQHHGVMILEDAVKDAVRLSHRYITGRQLPDKAISVIDTACARVAIAQNSESPVLEATRRRITRHEEELGMLQRQAATGNEENPERIAEIEAELEQLSKVKEELEERFNQELDLVRKVRELERELARQLKHDEERDEAAFAEQQTELQEAKVELTTLQEEDPMIPVYVDGRTIANVISAWTGIPVGKMMTDEVNTILNLPARLGERIIGQNHALDVLTRRIQTYHADLDDPGKPVGVFMLAGPSGVGKTETAVTLADLLFGGEANVITINMSEYQEAHTVSGLKGAPPGYVGYGKGGVLTEAVRRNPYSVVLLDEVEKAHPDVMELFFQVFDKGIMEDGDGVTVDFKNTIILLTTNIGTESIMAMHRSGVKPDAEALEGPVRDELLRRFKPAFLGRMVVIPYHPLGDDEIRQIARLKLDKITQRFEDNHRSRFTYDDPLVQAILERCTEVDSGARNIDHILTHTLLPTLSVEILERMARGDSFSAVHLSCDETGELTYQFDDEEAAENIAIEGEEDSSSPNRGPGDMLGDLDSLLDWLRQ
ncbi:MAG: type VI secretion system ATPase TssH [Pseudomonadota bacterium]